MDPQDRLFAAARANDLIGVRYYFTLPGGVRSGGAEKTDMGWDITADGFTTW